MSQLQVALLGTPTVRHNGTFLAFPTRKALALFCYLLVEKALQRRDSLTLLFWPESDAQHGRAVLRRTIAYIRATLKDDSHLVVTHDELGFNADSEFILDLDTVQKVTLTAYSSTPDEPLWAEFEQAANLYRGEFLEGFSLRDAPDFDQWASVQREHWHRRMERIWDQLSQWELERGELERAIDTATRWSAHDALSEDAARRVMQLQLTAGNYPAALQAYEKCRAMLATEFQAKPSPETEALAARIRAGTTSRQIRTLVRPAASKPSTFQVPLIGRAQQLRRLMELYHAAATGDAYIALLQGEAGIGKTRLAQEFLQWAQAEGANIMQGRSFELGGRLAYQPIVDVLRRRLSQQAALLDSLGETWRVELSWLLPELRDRFPQPHSPMLEDATARTRLFEAVARLGTKLADSAPVVLFLDDLQNADIASLDLIHYAGIRWAQEHARVLVVLSFRSEALATTPVLSQWTKALGQGLKIADISLDALTREQTTQLVEALAGNSHASDATIAEFSQWLYEETRGQPFFIYETLEFSRERGILQYELDEMDRWVVNFVNAVRRWNTLRGSVPPRVRDVLYARVARLAPDATALLTAGAVLGDGFSFEQLRIIAEVSENTALPALDQLLASGLLREVREEASDTLLYFTHDKIRDVVYSEAGEIRRVVFHRRAFYVLDRVGIPPAKLALHAFAGQLWEEAFRFSVAAGNDAARLFALRDAIEHYERAHTLARNELKTALHAAQLQELFLPLARAYELLDDPARASNVYEELWLAAHTENEAAVEGLALNRRATLAAQGHDLSRAMRLWNQALRAANTSGDKTLQAETEWNLAQIGYYTWQRETSLAHAERAVTLARELKLPDLEARSLNVLGYAHWMLHQWDAAREAAAAARVLFAALGDRAMETDCLCLCAEADLRLAKPQQAIITAQTAYKIGYEVQNAEGEIGSDLRLALGFLDMGAYQDALACSLRAVARTREVHDANWTVLALATLGATYRVQQRLGLAFDVHQEAYEITRESSTPLFQTTAAAQLCADAVLAEDWDNAQRFALEALVDRDVTLMDLGTIFWFAIEALLHANRYSDAEGELEKFARRTRTVSRYEIPVLRSRALLANARGDSLAAIRNLEQAAALSREQGLYGEQWQIQIALAEAYESRGDAEQARALRAAARDLIRVLGAQSQDDFWARLLSFTETKL